MGKTNRETKTDKTEMPGGNLPTWSKKFDLDMEAGLVETDLWHYARRVPPEEWPAVILREMGRRASVGPWRKAGENLDDWGAVPGTTEGARRYYFGATRGRQAFGGTVVANSARAVVVWLRDQERASSYASRNVLLAIDK